MAVLGRLLVSSAERLDLPDFLSIDSYAQGDFKYLMKSFVGSTRPYVLAGFDVINPGAAIGTQNVSIRVYDSVVYFPQSLAGPFFHGLEEGNTLSAPLVPELRKNTTNYIYLTLDTTEAAKDTRAFWDPDKEGGVGGEFTQDVNTESVLVAAINVSTSSFPEGTVPVAIVEVGPNFITSIEDARDMMFRLGTGGLSPDPLSSYAFREDPDATNARLEPNTLMTNALDPNSFQGGDKNIQSLKEWMDVVMTKLKELGGTTYWYEDTSTFGLVNIFKDALATSIKSKGNWNSSDATVGLLTWSEDILIQSVSDSQDIIVRAGNKTLTDNQTLYIPLERRQDINTGSVSVNWFNTLNKVNGTLGAFENLTKGDWIKKSDDPDYRYLRVEEFYAGLDLSGGVTAPGNALSIKLSDVYGGISELKRGVYSKGVYLSSDVLSADRDDPALSDIGGDLYWLAMRSDTIMSVADLTTTTLSIDISNHDGLTAKVDSIAHGLEDGQRIGISGTTNFDGVYSVEVEDVDTFYIDVTGGPFADEAGQSAYYTTVTTQVRSTVDGLQLESDEHGFKIDQTIQISDTTNYDGSFKVFPTGNTTFTMPATTAIANETSGSATAVVMYVRTDIGPTRLEQGADKAIGTVNMENMMSFIGMDNMSQTYPAYSIAPDYNTIDGFVNYNSEVTDNMTERVSKLTAMMADKAQDKTIIMAPSGYQTVSNALNGTARDITFNPAPSETPRLDIILPSSDQNNSIVLTGTISLEENQAAYIEIDRNDPQDLANLAAVTISNVTSVPLSENVYVLAVRLGTDEVWLWDGFYVSGGVTPIPSFLAQVVVQNQNAKMIEGGTWSYDLTSVQTGVAEAQSFETFAIGGIATNIAAITADTTDALAQSFTANSAEDVTKIRVALRRIDGTSTFNLQASIHADVAGLPAIGALHTSTNSINSGTLTAVTGSTVDFTFAASTNLAIGTKYHLVISATSGVLNTDSVLAGVSNATDPYASHNISATSNWPTGGWSSTAAGRDLYIAVFTNEPSFANQDALTLSADAYIQIPGLTKERNTIEAQTIPLLNDDEVAYVELVRSSGAATNLTVTVADEASVPATLNTFVIARRTADGALVGNSSFLLKTGEYLELDGALAEINRFFGQLKLVPENPNSTKVKITGADIDKLDSSALGQELAGLAMKFDGALMDFATGTITESDGVTPLGQNFTPVTIAANQYRWHSVSLIPNIVDAENRISAQVLVLPGDADGATADAAPRGVYGGTKKIGQVVVQDDGAGGAGTILDIGWDNIVQLGTGSGSGSGGGGPKMIGGGVFEWNQSVAPADIYNVTTKSANQGIINANFIYGQGFVATSTDDLASVTVSLSKQAAADTDIECEIYSESAGLPNTLLATSTNVVNTSAISVEPASIDHVFNFTGLTLTNATTYFFVIRPVNIITLSGVDRVNVKQSALSEYPSGGQTNSSDGGSSWSAQSATNDLYGKVAQLVTSDPELSFQTDFYIEQPRLDYADNTVSQATYSPIVLPTTNDVAFIERLNASSGGPNLTVIVDDIKNVKDGQIIIARRDGDDVIVGSTSTRLAYDDKALIYGELIEEFKDAICYTDNSTAPLNCSVATTLGITRVTLNEAYTPGVNPGKPTGQLEVIVDGQSVSRFVDLATTPPGCTSYIEESDTVISLQKDFSAVPVEVRIYRRAKIIDSNNANTAAIAALQAASGAGAAGTSIEIDQTAHGFAVGDGVFHNGTVWEKGLADDADTLATFTVTEVPTANKFIAYQFGRVEVTGHGFTPGEWYLLSDTVAGQPTSVAPTSNYSNPLFYAEDANFLQVSVYRPSVVGGGGGSGEANTASNLGTGDGVFASKVADDLQFKSLKAGTNVTLTPSGTEILIDAAGGTSSTPQRESFILNGTDISNGYVDLANVATANSIQFFVSGLLSDETVDYTVSLTGGGGGNTRLDFSAHAPTLAIGNKVIVYYVS